MNRNLIATVMACLYVAGSIWIVRSAGQSYRASLNQTIPLPREIDRASSPPMAEKEKAVPSVAASELDEPPFKAATTKKCSLRRIPPNEPTVIPRRPRR